MEGWYYALVVMLSIEHRSPVDGEYSRETQSVLSFSMRIGMAVGLRRVRGGAWAGI